MSIDRGPRRIRPVLIQKRFMSQGIQNTQWTPEGDKESKSVAVLQFADLKKWHFELQHVTLWDGTRIITMPMFTSLNRERAEARGAKFLRGLGYEIRIGKGSPV